VTAIDDPSHQVVADAPDSRRARRGLRRLIGLTVGFDAAVLAFAVLAAAVLRASTPLWGPSTEPADHLAGHSGPLLVALWLSW